MIIENYKELLSAIFNSDNSQEKVKSVICVYDTYENDRLMAVFSKSKYCAEFFNTSSETIDCNICRKNLRKDRYRLERIKLEEEYD